MGLNKLIGEVLEELIKDKSITLTKLSKKTGFTHSYLSKIVAGNLPKLPVNTLEKVVYALNLTMSDFMGLVEKKKLVPLSN